ncbi:hypothetical protein C8J57DRAFT_1513708 [Mycena rebaudengoi]|nr:hypothetical protein C8J57DRAFT_1513708 [Mycena rebaudengoi]
MSAQIFMLPICVVPKRWLEDDLLKEKTEGSQMPAGRSRAEFGRSWKWPVRQNLKLSHICHESLIGIDYCPLRQKATFQTLTHCAVRRLRLRLALLPRSLTNWARSTRRSLSLTLVVVWIGVSDSYAYTDDHAAVAWSRSGGGGAFPLTLFFIQLICFCGGSWDIYIAHRAHGSVISTTAQSVASESYAAHIAIDSPTSALSHHYKRLTRARRVQVFHLRLHHTLRLARRHHRGPVSPTGTFSTTRKASSIHAAARGLRINDLLYRKVLSPDIICRDAPPSVTCAAHLSS